MDRGVGRVEFETLLSDISARLITVDPDRLDEAIESALHDVRRFFEVDRCGILLSAERATASPR
jgi:hypothetical protein